jgi:hypothetical protein
MREEPMPEPKSAKVTKADQQVIHEKVYRHTPTMIRVRAGEEPLLAAPARQASLLDVEEREVEEAIPF